MCLVQGSRRYFSRSMKKKRKEGFGRRDLLLILYPSAPPPSPLHHPSITMPCPVTFAHVISVQPHAHPRSLGIQPQPVAKRLLDAPCARRREWDAGCRLVSPVSRERCRRASTPPDPRPNPRGASCGRGASKTLVFPHPLWPVERGLCADCAIGWCCGAFLFERRGTIFPSMSRLGARVISEGSRERRTWLSGSINTC